MKQTRRAMLTAGGSLLATGCLRLTTEQETRESTNGTSTSTEATATPEIQLNFPPGVTESGVTFELLQRHRRNLRDGNFSNHILWQSPGDDRTHKYVIDHPEYLVTTVDRDRHRTITVYTADDFESGVARAETPTTTIYSRYPEQRFTDMGDGSGALSQHIRGAAFEPTGQAEHEGEPVVELSATSVDAPDELRVYDSGDEYEGRLYVTEGGIIVKSEIKIDYQGRKTDYVYESTLTDIGSTSVTKPAWDGTARRRAPEFDIRFVDDRSAVRVELVDGAPIEQAITVAAWEGGEGTNIGTRIEDGLQVGEVLYLGRQDHGRMDVFDTRPESTEQLAKYLRIELTAEVTLYEDVLEG